MSRFRVVLSKTAYVRFHRRRHSGDGYFMRRMVVVSRQPHWWLRNTATGTERTKP